MALDTHIAQTALDFKGLAELRRSATKNKTDPDTLKQVASQFEALFIGMMLKSMRQAKLADGIFDSSHSDMYRDMYDQQLALDMARKGGLGLQHTLIRQLGGQSEAGQRSGHSQLLPVKPERTYLSPPPSFAATQIKAMKPAARLSVSTFSSPEDFVRTLYPLAQQAAKKLGTRTEVLLAQAALETGWGKHILASSNQQSSHNLFNIKADSRWQGETVSKMTLEYAQGITQKVPARFRAYPDFQASFDDYVRFLQTQPRYQAALRHAPHPDDFIDALHRAGYATDPAYAEKIKQIMRSPVLAQISQQFKYS